jgi:hypothetical protein
MQYREFTWAILKHGRVQTHKFNLGGPSCFDLTASVST